MFEIKLNPKAYRIYELLMWLGLICICLNWSLNIVPVYYRPYQTVSNPIIEAKLTQLKRLSNFNEPVEVRMSGEYPCDISALKNACDVWTL